MSYATFPTSGMYGVTACMLSRLGVPADDRTIALGMELPYLFALEDGIYKSGTELNTPDWLNLYLLPKGFHMVSKTIPKEDLCAVLSDMELAALPLAVTPDSRHCVVYTGQKNRKFTFENPCLPGSAEPEELSLSHSDLLKQTADEVMLYTLHRCPPQTVDMKPYLIRSLHTLHQYRQEIHDFWPRSMTPEQLQELCQTHLRSLMFFSLPMAKLADDMNLYIHIRLLLNSFRPLLYGRMQTITPDYYLPIDRLETCIFGLWEIILDRLSGLGMSDAEIDRLAGRR